MRKRKQPISPLRTSCHPIYIITNLGGDASPSFAITFISLEAITIVALLRFRLINFRFWCIMTSLTELFAKFN